MNYRINFLFTIYRITYAKCFESVWYLANDLSNLVTFQVHEKNLKSGVIYHVPS